jgi:hypothetical protein
MFRTITLGTLATGAIAAAAIAGTATPAIAASPDGGACQLAGTANFDQPLSAMSAGPFGYSFTGQLSSCQESSSGPAGGEILAGADVKIGGYNYKLPEPTLTGSCANSTTSGTAVIQWTGGSTTVISYSTTSGGAAVELNGSVVGSVTATLDQNAPAGTPATATVTTNQYAGYGAGGLLAFAPTDPQDCAGAGVTSSPIDGVVGLGATGVAGAPFAKRTHATKHATRRRHV